MSYAEGTRVTVSKSRSEIIGLLEDRGIDRYLVGVEGGSSFVVFQHNGLSFKLTVPPPKGKATTQRTLQQVLEQEERRLWRVLAMTVKAKLVAIEEGISTFESEFLANVVTDKGATLIDRMRPALERARESGGPLALPGGGWE